MGRLAALPLNARFAPAMEATVKIDPAGYVNLYGMDAITEGSGRTRRAPDRLRQRRAGLRHRTAGRAFAQTVSDQRPLVLHSADVPLDARPISSPPISPTSSRRWALWKAGSHRRVPGKGESLDRVESMLRAKLPAGYQITRPGTRSAENQKMLRSVPVESAHAELHRAGGGRVPDLQHDLDQRGSAPAGDRHPARAGRRSRAPSSRCSCWKRRCSASPARRPDWLLGRLLADSMVSLISQTVRSFIPAAAPRPFT